MAGTLLNVATILVGTLLGLLVGNRLTAKMQESVMFGLGMVTLVIAVQNAMTSGNILIPLLSLVAGIIIGELLNLEAGLNALGGWLQTQATRVLGRSGDTAAARQRFISGFVTASLLFCIGPMAILGSIQNGMDPNNTRILTIKSTLDFFAAIAFAASLGIGVAFSVLPTLVIQGAFALLGMSIIGAAGATLNANNPYIREFAATGGIILLGIALTLMDVKKPRVANFLPALLVCPLLMWFATEVLKITLYP
jgi:uncharacterized protein